MIKKYYKKKRQYRNLIIGVLWAIFAFSGFVFQDNYSMRLLDYAWLVLSILHFGLYFFEHYTAYVMVKNNVISTYSPFPKRMDIKDIIDIKKSPTNYILKSNTKELKINPEYINDDDLVKLNLFLDGIQPKA
ncbi:hypothetical protein [Formosa sp. PL04]|uniref:hypothetical protein n=1 Tax=Formosa sp. PL04 TaxID=3081755 RepID=UPI0029813FE4|nr:hypothetical protein [Formosa sp. PL04]MDW5287663.1 hypothetical protein [Formosa sp. PL04]